MIDKNGQTLLELANTQKQSIDALREYIVREEDDIEKRTENLHRMRKTLALLEKNYSYMLAAFSTVEYSKNLDDKEPVKHFFQVWMVSPSKKIDAIKAFRECFTEERITALDRAHGEEHGTSPHIGLGLAKAMVEGAACNLFASPEQLVKFYEFLNVREIGMDLRVHALSSPDMVNMSSTVYFRPEVL